MAAAINLRTLDPLADQTNVISVEMYAFTAGKQITLSFYQSDTNQDGTDDDLNATQPFGQVTGTLAVLNAPAQLEPSLTLTNPTVNGQPTQTKAKLHVVFPQPDGAADSAVDLYLPDDNLTHYDGEAYEIFAASVDDEVVRSPKQLIASIRRALPLTGASPKDTYSFHQGNQLKFYHNESAGDASEGYFHDIVTVINQATDFIFVVNWSFHALLRVVREGTFSKEQTIGYLLVKRAIECPKMLIAIHVWDHTNLFAADAPNDSGDDMLDNIAKICFGLSKRPSNLLWRKSSRTGIGNTHHQKFLVADSRLTLSDNFDLVPAAASEKLRPWAFVGGIDLTKGRFDLADHPNLPSANDPTGGADTDPFAQQIVLRDGDIYRVDDWYNAEFLPLEGFKNKNNQKPTVPRQTWHDIAVSLCGPTAWDFIREFVGRWMLDPSDPLPDFIRQEMHIYWSVPFACFGDGLDTAPRVLNVFKSLFTKTVAPGPTDDPKITKLAYAQQWETVWDWPWTVQLCRSLKKEHWAQSSPITIDCADYSHKEFEWKIQGEFERSIQDTYLNAIAQAEDYIYIESQFFITAGDLWDRRAVKNSVGNALLEKAKERFKSQKPFHIYIVLPMFPEGPPTDASGAAIRQFQWKSVRAVAREIEKAIGGSYKQIMSVYFLAKWADMNGSLYPLRDGGHYNREQMVTKNMRYQVYVHAKFMMIDDRYAFIGTANLNERSLAGNVDSEIGVAIWPNCNSVADQCKTIASNFRKEVWKNHLKGAYPDGDSDNPGSRECVQKVQDAARANYKAFRTGTFDPGSNGPLCLYEFNPDLSQPLLENIPNASELGYQIPDSPSNLSGSDVSRYQFAAPGPQYKVRINLASKRYHICE